MLKVTSLEEANSRVPELKRIFGKISEINEISVSLSKDIQVLYDIWGDSIRMEGNPDHAFFREKVSRKEILGREIREEISRIGDIGGILKDLQRGLVDFYLENSGEPIYLCWKAGEDSIRHWHPVRGGYSGRRPIEELEARPLF